MLLVTEKGETFILNISDKTKLNIQNVKLDQLSRTNPALLIVKLSINLVFFVSDDLNH